MIQYQVELAEPLAHRLHIRCTVEHPRVEGEQFRLPTWIPGSYLIREFARHVVDVQATQNEIPIQVSKIDKQTWQTEALKGSDPLSLVLIVHAWDLSVRGAHFDQFHAFFNGCSVFPEVLGREGEQCQARIKPFQGIDGLPWEVFTTLPLDTPIRYQELLDHPVEMGPEASYSIINFEIKGTPHRMVLRGAGTFNQARLQQDLTRICTAAMDLFGGQAPFPNYDFLVTLTGDGYGGLEHRSSTALLASRDDLPPCGLIADTADTPPGEGYARFLELCSHEYFHAWVVKRICDQSFVRSTLQAEAYSRLLWFFEGFTSYYDALMLVRAGVISADSYLRLLEKTVQQVSSVPGQWRQSLAESSFDAWIKYYRPDDNTPNTVVSYYAKGSLIALALDVWLRRQGLSADAWLQALWVCFGKTETPLTENALFKHLEQFAGLETASTLKRWVEAREPLVLEHLLLDFGIAIKDDWETVANTPLAWGLRVAQEQGLVRVTHVLDGSPAQVAGLAAGDLWVAVDGLRVTYANLETRLQRMTSGRPVSVLVFREDVLITLSLCNNEDHLQPLRSWPTLRFDPIPTRDLLLRRAEWLSSNFIA